MTAPGRLTEGTRRARAPLGRVAGRAGCSVLAADWSTGHAADRPLFSLPFKRRAGVGMVLLHAVS
jgi:hypothetical protein